MKNGASRGCIAWHELWTTEPDAAIAFYTRTIGWSVDPASETPDPRLKASDRPIGAIVTLAGARERHAPHWLTYLGCGDVDATCRQAETLGGAVVVPPCMFSAVGRRAVLQDPQGALFGIATQAAGTEGKARVTTPGEFSWHELATTDCEDAFRFYGSLFGWEHTGQFDLGAAGMYYLCGHRGLSFGGVCSVGSATSAPAWLPYIHVDDVRIAADRMGAYGGSVAVPVHEVPGGEWVVVGTDPQGARFAAHQLKPR
ncbi:MAG: VOC family protein [Gemmatimonadaceae bacterium]